MIDRYATPAMSAIWSDDEKQRLFRTIWRTVLEAQTGVYSNSDELQQALFDTLAVIDTNGLLRVSGTDMEDIILEEAKCGHEVEAARRVFQRAIRSAATFPIKHDLIHLDLTSSDITDLADDLRMARSTDLVTARILHLTSAMSNAVNVYKDDLAVGYTHMQEAEITTHGYRLAGHMLEMLEIAKELMEAEIPAKSVRGAVGLGTGIVVWKETKHFTRDLDDQVLQMLLISEQVHLVLSDHATQTSPRHAEYRLMLLFDRFAAAAHRLGITARFLQSKGVWIEDRKGRTGSSAMPGKTNPQSWETICSLAQMLHSSISGLWHMTANQIAERTLDDSAIRRVSYPDIFALAETLAIRTEDAISRTMCIPLDDGLVPPSALVSLALSAAVRGRSDLREVLHVRVGDIARSSSTAYTFREALNAAGLVMYDEYDKAVSLDMTRKLSVAACDGAIAEVQEIIANGDSSG